jgi:hypothetical protein
MRAEFHPEALAEYEDAVIFYQSRQSKLGSRFIASVQAALPITAMDMRFSLGKKSAPPKALKFS